MLIFRRFKRILSVFAAFLTSQSLVAHAVPLFARPGIYIVWVALLIHWLTLQCPAHMTGVSYADVEIRKQEISVWLQVNLRELKYARQFDRNNDLLITEQEIQEGYRQFEPQLLSQFRISGAGQEGQGRIAEVSLNPQRGELRFHLIFVFTRPLDDVAFKVTLHALTDSGHWSLAQIRYDGVEEQRYFNLETPEARVELRRGVQSYLRLSVRSAAYAVNEFFATPDTLAFVLALILIESAWESLLVVVGMFFFGQVAAYSFDTLYGPFLSVRFLQSAAALSVAYIAAENVLIKEVRYRGVIAAVLGLVYGLNFSEMVRSVGYPKKGVFLSLLSFQLSLGVVLVLSTFLLFVIMYRIKLKLASRHITLLLSIGLIGVGIFRFVQVTF